MNEIMRVLTVISTIFMPLSFIVGLYGMNFNTTSPWNMPELNWRYGYPLVLATLVVVTLGLLYFFHRRGWLGRQWGPEHYPATGDATVEPSYDRPASRF